MRQAEGTVALLPRYAQFLHAHLESRSAGHRLAEEPDLRVLSAAPHMLAAGPSAAGPAPEHSKSDIRAPAGAQTLHNWRGIFRRTVSMAAAAPNSRASSSRR